MLRFTIIDYTTNPIGVETQIDEPIGWDGITLRIKRDKEWHGFFDFADDSTASLQFVGDGFGILKTAYETYGASANVQLLIEYQCAEGDIFEELYLGRFVFSTYKDVRGDECFSTITLEALNCLMIFRNRYDQQVDLDSLLSFDNCVGINITGVTCDFVAAASEITLYGQILVTDIVGQYLYVSGSVSNDGTYTVINTATFGSDTVITVSETLVDEMGAVCNISSGCLVPYDGLNKEITLPSKIIFLESKALSTESVSLHAIQNPTSPSYPTGYLPNGTGGYSTGSRDSWFTLASNVIQSDLSTMNGSIPEYAPNGINADSNPSAVLKLDLLPICPSFQVRIQISFSGTFVNTGSANRSEELKFILLIGDSAYGGTVIDNPILYGYTGSVPDTQNFTYSYDNIITLNAGQSIFYYFFYDCFKSDTLQNDPTIRFNNDLIIDLSSESECNPTQAGVYLVNETMSRCVEAYTNDCMRVYSDYFGRTDAQPYTSAEDGCGGLRAILNGLRIRNAPNSDGVTEQKFTTSMKDMFESLNSTDNIGMGLEDDPFRPYENKKLIRVEPQQYFYNDTVLMTCDSIRFVNRDVDASLIFSTIKLGYQKWKTWNINGLNDIFTPREYRTELSELKNELDKTCKFLASDYAIEWTRRQYGLTTADSRYDNDTFFICLTREPYNYDVEGSFIAFIGTIVLQGTSFQMKIGDQITISGTVSNNGNFTISGLFQNDILGTTSLIILEPLTDETGVTFNIQSLNIPYIVEQGIDSASNILNADTVINYRIAPSRNAMRWMKTILKSYRDYLTKSIVFTSGEGNILASGEVLTPCRIENAVIAENQNLSLDNFADAADNYPLFYPELVKFEYPMSYTQYLTVKANPYGLIGYQCGSSAMEYGWIEDMQYSPFNGLVNFVLRPKIV